MKRVAIHSVPRSGSTWLGSIFDSHPEVIYKYQPLFSYRFKGALTTESTKEDIVDFFLKMSATPDDFTDQQTAKNKGIVPVFSKIKASCLVYKEVRYHHILSNLLMQDDEVFVIGLIRNPLSTLYSWWEAPREFRKDLGWNFDNEWRLAPSKNQGHKEEFYGYEKWKEVAQLFQLLRQKYPERFYLLHYNKLLSETESEVHKVFDFVGLEMNRQTLSFISASKQRDEADAYAVYKKKNNDRIWQGKLPNTVVQAVTKDLMGTPLAIYLDE